MEIENNKEQVPFEYYEELFSKADPAEIAGRLGEVSWDGSAFTVGLLNRKFAISHPKYEIRALDGGKLPPLPTQTFLLRYLLEGKALSANGRWLTFREMPWGELYIKPYTGRVLTRAAFTLGTRVEAFKKAAQEMGAQEVKSGDAGFLFPLVGEYAMQILIWEGDEEFPPSAQVLYSDNFADGFAAEDRVVAGDILITAIKANM